MKGEEDKLSILLISDGRPGHFNLAEGIVAALGRIRPLEVMRLDVRRPGWLPARTLSSLVNQSFPAERLLAWVFGARAADLGNPDIIVSAGGDTLAANVAGARLTGAANVFYGSLRRYRPGDFSLVLTSYASQADAPNRLMWLKPSKLDPDAEAFGLSDADSHETLRDDEGQVRLGLIVGGDSGTVRYRTADWDRLVEFVETYAKQTSAGWVVANGPRTPAAVSDRLAGLASGLSSPVARFVDFRVAGPGTLGSLLASVDTVLCTADSSSMLSETVWMRRRAIAIAPCDFRLPENEMAYRKWMESNGWVREVQIADLSPVRIQDCLADLQPLRENPLEQLAAELKRRLPVLSD